MAAVYSDEMGDIRAWARAQPDINAVVGGRVFFGIPDSPTFPLLRIYQAAWRPLGEAPTADSVVTFECWGSSFGDATALRTAVLGATHFLINTRLGATWVYNAEPVTAHFLPDPTNNRPRYVCDVVFTVRAASAAEQAA